jgi:predicted RecB family nuclease
MATKITLDILENHLNCKYKSYIRFMGQEGIKSDYEILQIESQRKLKLKAVAKINSRYSAHEITHGVTLNASSLNKGASFIFDAYLHDNLLSVHFDGLEKVEGRSQLGEFHYIPVLFHESRQIRKAQRLLLEMLALLLSRAQGKAPSRGVIYHGIDCTGTTVRFTAGLAAAEKLLDEVTRLQRSEVVPTLLLNDHCHVCEFRQQCHAQAVKEDSLSLLRGLGEKEIRAYSRKGVFTLTQLAHTFRPRRKGKRSDRGSKRRYHALQALAIRDKTIYVLGAPEVPAGAVRIYLDAEGNPEEGFVYLIGMIVRDDSGEEHYSFWANSKDQEHQIFEQFLAVVSRYDNPCIFCYGRYERTFIKRMRRHARRKKQVDKVLGALVNTLSIIYYKL